MTVALIADIQESVFFFYSPKFTWAMMCGVGGDMIICPECKIQAEFNETIRN